MVFSCTLFDALKTVGQHIWRMPSLRLSIFSFGVPLTEPGQIVSPIYERNTQPGELTIITLVCLYNPIQRARNVFVKMVTRHSHHSSSYTLYNIFRSWNPPNQLLLILFLEVWRISSLNHWTSCHLLESWSDVHYALKVHHFFTEKSSKLVMDLGT